MSETKIDLSDMVCFISPRAGYDQGRLTMSFTIDGDVLQECGHVTGDVLTKAQHTKIIHAIEARVKKGFYDG